MLIGSRICLRGGTIAEYLGLASQNAARVKIGDEVRTVPLSLVRRGSGQPYKSKWAIGSSVTVDLLTVRNGSPVTLPLAGEVVGQSGHGPKVKITAWDPVWEGAIVQRADGKIRRVGE